MADRLADVREREDRLRKGIEALTAKNDFLDRYGADFTFYRKWEPYLDPESPFVLGRCDGTPCVELQYRGIFGAGPTTEIRFALTDRAGLADCVNDFETPRDDEFSVSLPASSTCPPAG